KGITNLFFPNDKDTINKAREKYGQIEKVNLGQYDFHNQIIEYLKGRLIKFSLPLDLRGTEFQNKVWNELLNIPYVETRTYKELAENIRTTIAYRAVGGALNKNPIQIIVTCHRVISYDGQLVGFAGGVDLKTRLLKLERKNI